MKTVPAISGVVLLALVGWLIGVLIEHPPGPGGLQFIGALIGAMIALAALLIGESIQQRTD